MNWDTNYPYDKFKPPQGYKLQPVNPEQNHVISREQLEDCGHLPHLIAQFKEKYILFEVESVWLIRKLKEGNGFQDWHQDLACNGQIVYTIVVNLGAKEIQVDAEEIDIDDIAYAADVQPPSASENSDRNYEDINNDDYIDEGESKLGSVA